MVDVFVFAFVIVIVMVTFVAAAFTAMVVFLAMFLVRQMFFLVGLIRFVTV